MATPSPRRRKPRKGGTPSRGKGSGIRIALALVILVAGLAAVLYVGLRETHRVTPTPVPTPRVDPAEVVREVARRVGGAAATVEAREEHDAKGTLWSIAVRTGKGFDGDRFSLDLEAAAHNLGGRLEPLPLTEKGGYGVARLEGTVQDQRWRVLVLREVPAPAPVRTTAARPRPPGPPRLAIVLDDAGNSLEPMAAVARLPQAVAVAVLPNAPHAREVAREVGAQHRELLLHMPMEPIGNHGAAGPGAVEVGLPAAEIERRVEQALAVVAGAAGVNNHMGSRATADRDAMHAVMKVLHARGLFFLDSRTTPETVAEDTAREDGVPALRRDVFLDVVATPDAIRAALHQAVARARAQGTALAIGHVHPVTLEVLAAELPDALGDVTLVRPSRLLGE